MTTATLARSPSSPPAPVQESGIRPRVDWSLLLGAWSVAYVLPHLYWALGGEAFLFTVKESAAEMDDWKAINWAASVVLTGAALLGPALVVSASHPRLRRVTLAACAGGAAIATSHGAFGILYRALNVTGVTDVEGAEFDASSHEWVLWDLFVFEPWFLIEGLLFIAAGAAALKTARGRRRWVTGCLAAAGLATMTGLLGLRF